MITGVHTMFYSAQADELRAFLRDKLGLSATDVGGGWLIFDVPDAEMGCHPADPEKGAPSGMHNISFYCDDIEKTMADLKSRGVEFTAPVEDQGYGLVTHFRLPGDFTVQLYQPRYRRNPRPIAAAVKPTPAKKKRASAKKKAGPAQVRRHEIEAAWEAALTIGRVGICGLGESLLLLGLGGEKLLLESNAKQSQFGALRRP